MKFYSPVIDQLKPIKIMAYKSFQESLVWQKSEALLLALSREMLKEEAAWMRKKLMKAVDILNEKYGRMSVRFAVNGPNKKQYIKQEKLSPCYTTRISDLLKIR